MQKTPRVKNEELTVCANPKNILECIVNPNYIMHHPVNKGGGYLYGYFVVEDVFKVAFKPWYDSDEPFYVKEIGGKKYMWVYVGLTTQDEPNDRHRNHVIYGRKGKGNAFDTVLDIIIRHYGYEAVRIGWIWHEVDETLVTVMHKGKERRITTLAKRETEFMLRANLLCGTYLEFPELHVNKHAYNDKLYDFTTSLETRIKQGETKKGENNPSAKEATTIFNIYTGELDRGNTRELCKKWDFQSGNMGVHLADVGERADRCNKILSVNGFIGTRKESYEEVVADLFERYYRVVTEALITKLILAFPKGREADSYTFDERVCEPMTRECLGRALGLTKGQTSHISNVLNPNHYQKSSGGYTYRLLTREEARVLFDNLIAPQLPKLKEMFKDA